MPQAGGHDDLDEYASRDAIGLRELIAAGEVSAGGDRGRRARGARARPTRASTALPRRRSTRPSSRDADGPLAGVPFLIKDFGPMARACRSSAAAAPATASLARRDSDLMTRVRAAGLSRWGSPPCPELALSFATEPRRTGPTRNPWDLERGVGGSSGGSAALVAAGAVPIAHGNDGAGSIRIPASCCGLVGLSRAAAAIPCGPGWASRCSG